MSLKLLKVYQDIIDEKISNGEINIKLGYTICKYSKTNFVGKIKLKQKKDKIFIIKYYNNEKKQLYWYIKTQKNRITGIQLLLKAGDPFAWI